MKRLVEESLPNFKRGQDPKGSMDIGYEGSQNRGIRAYALAEKINHIQPPSMKKVIESIERYEKATDGFIELGVDPKDISIIFDESKFSIKIWQIIRAGWGIGNTLTEEDAKGLTAASMKYDMSQYDEKDYIIKKSDHDYFLLEEAERYIKTKIERDAS